MDVQRFCLVSVVGVLVAMPLVFGQEPAGTDKSGKTAGKKGETAGFVLPPLPPSLLRPDSRPLDVASALQLAGVQNPEILLARERVVEAVALRQLAAAQILPTLNAGTNLDHHDGTLQSSNGTILQVNRDALYLGLGADAVGAGTVNIPGLVWSGNVSAVLFQNLVSRQVVRQRTFADQAVRNQVLLRVAQEYMELLRADGRRAVGERNLAEAREVQRITANYAKTGQGRQADADRAATEADKRTNDLIQAESDVLTSSARLCQLLGLDPSVRLHPADGYVVPQPIVPDPIPLSELLAIAMTQRPELAERQAAIRAAFLELRNAKLLPFSPNVILGYSAGDFGGGSNLVQQGILQPNGTVLQQSRFGNYADREDLDVVVYWSLRNLGLGNLGLVRLAKSNLRQNELRNLAVLDQVRAEVAAAYARTHARYAQLQVNERAVEAGSKSFEEDLRRIRDRVGLPIEVMNSMQLLGRSRLAYLDSIIDYNIAHFELYVALGQPPANYLVRPIPASLVAPGESKTNPK
jgi:outer membrane protein TolC